MGKRKRRDSSVSLKNYIRDKTIILSTKNKKNFYRRQRVSALGRSHFLRGQNVTKEPARRGGFRFPPLLASSPPKTTKHRGAAAPLFGCAPGGGGLDLEGQLLSEEFFPIEVGVFIVPSSPRRGPRGNSKRGKSKSPLLSLLLVSFGISQKKLAEAKQPQNQAATKKKAAPPAGGKLPIETINLNKAKRHISRSIFKPSVNLPLNFPIST